jgi:hypothetical protein
MQSISLARIADQRGVFGRAHFGNSGVDCRHEIFGKIIIFLRALSRRTPVLAGETEKKDLSFLWTIADPRANLEKIPDPCETTFPPLLIFGGLRRDGGASPAFHAPHSRGPPRSSVSLSTRWPDHADSAVGEAIPARGDARRNSSGRHREIARTEHRRRSFGGADRDPLRK